MNNEDSKLTRDTINKYAFLFVENYRKIVDQKYSAVAFRFPFNKGYNIRIVNINDYQLIELVFTLSDKRVMIESVEYPAKLSPPPDITLVDFVKQNEDAHKKEVVSRMDLNDVIAHIILYPPFENRERYIKDQAEDVVEEHYIIISSDFGLLDRIKTCTGGDVLVGDIDEIKRCLLHRLYRPAISSIAVAMENAFIVRFFEEGRDIRQEERNGKQWFLPELNKEAYKKYNLISDKTFDRINILNKLRRFGTHSESGSTIEQDANFAFSAFEQALQELFKQ